MALNSHYEENYAPACYAICYWIDHATKIRLYCEANNKIVDFQNNVNVQDDGAGAYIKSWSVDGLTKPTDSQLASYETAGNTEEKNNSIKRLPTYSINRLDSEQHSYITARNFPQFS